MYVYIYIPSCLLPIPYLGSACVFESLTARGGGAKINWFAIWVCSSGFLIRFCIIRSQASSDSPISASSYVVADVIDSYQF